MEFRLLGPLEVTGHERSLDLGATEKRSFLPSLTLSMR
jgi:hypothetical protein